MTRHVRGGGGAPPPPGGGGGGGGGGRPAAQTHPLPHDAPGSSAGFARAPWGEGPEGGRSPPPGWRSEGPSIRYSLSLMTRHVRARALPAPPPGGGGGGGGGGPPAGGGGG